jgi:hypothetical protein
MDSGVMCQSRRFYRFLSTELSHEPDVLKRHGNGSLSGHGDGHTTRTLRRRSRPAGTATPDPFDANPG